MKLSELLSDESKWIKGRFAVDSDGNMVSTNDPSACRFCLEGAIYRCCRGPGLGQILNRVDIRTRAKGYNSIPAFNDDENTTFEDIKTLLNEVGL